MKKDEWIQQPMDERLQWYDEQLSKLQNNLQKQQVPGTVQDLLKEIKMRMIYDNTPSEERSVESEEQKKYHSLIYKAYKKLPNMDTSTEDWSKPLEKTRAIITEGRQ
ncbi:MAG: hypothetical protein U5K69_29130 [Balneolaceae bacterium]|nr:hypothetical protein [Balneolaceae bacterium]